MTEKYSIPDGQPVDMSKVTLGEPYTSADMYRDMGIEPPTAPDGVVYVDTVRTVTVHIGEGGQL